MKKWHSTVDPRRRGWILNDTWLNMLRDDGAIILNIHHKGSWMERCYQNLDGSRYETKRIMDVDADEVISWCLDNEIKVTQSPVSMFDSVRGIILDGEDQEFAFRMRWPSFV